MNARHGILRPWRPLASFTSPRTIQTRFRSTDVTAKYNGNGGTAPSHPQPTLDVPRTPKTAETVAAAATDGLLSEQVRRMMRRVPHPLIVILAQGTQNPHHSGLPSGLLVSSFNTITLTPAPYVSFNLKVPSSTYQSIQTSGGFVASAISNPHTARDFFLRKESVEYRTALRENVVDDGRSILRDGKGGIWWMECSFMDKESVEVGDHVVVIGKVMRAGLYRESRDQVLIYSEGKYRVAGEGVDVTTSPQQNARKVRNSKPG
ncbi:MAG: hypothetical protein LQ348_000978 [Seirophora lacunosa]|nr:MAG: hypothetical protein LQ348_000978 [Seirophora lacunosa]